MHAPSRQPHRDQRAQFRRATIRQRLVGIPLALIGIALIGLGTYSFMNGRAAPASDVQVGGLTLERPAPTTTALESPSDASVRLPEGSSPLVGIPMPGTADTIVAVSPTSATPDRSAPVMAPTPGT